MFKMNDSRLTDEVIDGTDKALCMYDVYEKAVGFKRPTAKFPINDMPKADPDVMVQLRKDLKETSSYKKFFHKEY